MSRRGRWVGGEVGWDGSVKTQKLLNFNNDITELTL